MTVNDVSGFRSESVVFRLELSDFGAFYERTYDTAYRTALGIVREPALAADVTQEAYVAAYRNRHRYRGDAPSTAWSMAAGSWRPGPSSGPPACAPRARRNG